MINLVKKVLDDNKIKNYYRKTNNPDGGVGINVFFIDLEICEDEKNKEEKNKEEVPLMLWFSDENKPQYINFTVSKAGNVPAASKTKVKNLLLDIDAFIPLGSFGVIKGTSIIRYTFSELVHYSKDGQDMLQLESIPKYLYIIGRMIENLRKELNKIENSDIEMDKIQNE